MKAEKMVIVISGGTSGLGREIAKKLSPQYDVIILARSRNELKKVAAELGCDFSVCDVSDIKNVRGAVKSIIKKYKKIDCLIDNAGIWIEGALEKNKPEQIEKVFAVNTLGTIYLAREVVSYMKNKANGLIINIISQAGLYGKKERSVYNSSKWAITGFTKSLQQELSPYGIRVTGVYPGFMKTNLFSNFPRKRDWSTALSAEEVAKAVAYIVSLPDEVMIPEIGIKHTKNLPY